MGHSTGIVVFGIAVCLEMHLIFVTQNLGYNINLFILLT
uniref:Uncharacterized protein n=1 Tax=Anguilla anguilla TaxID=7936 RepID=A0A0E9T5T1_ANGAN